MATGDKVVTLDVLKEAYEGHYTEAAMESVITADDARLSQMNYLLHGWYSGNNLDSNAGKIVSPGSCYWFKAPADCTIYATWTTDRKVNIRVSNEQPAYNTAWTGKLYDSTWTSELPQPTPATGQELVTTQDETHQISVTTGQYVAIFQNGHNWTLHVNYQSITALKPNFGLTPQMRSEVEAMLAEVQALILENNG